MIQPLRRGLVIAGTAATLVVGLFSIRVAADLAATAAPPPAPPVSIETLRKDLAAEQARGAELESVLDQLTGLTADLTTSIGTTRDQVSLDGLSADELRARLLASQAKLSKLSKLLATADARLVALRAAAAEQAAAEPDPTAPAASEPEPPPPTPSEADPVPAPPTTTPTPSRTQQPTQTPEWRGTPEPGDD